ncbi:MAG TPA: peptidoglycan-binding domain-containing protein, partial [Polyangia bacterium]
MRAQRLLLLALPLLALACRAQQQAAPDSPRPMPPPTTPAPPMPTPPQAQPAPGEPPPVVDPNNRVMVIEDGKETWIDATAATAQGYTVVDLSDDWTPFLFAEQWSAAGELLPNRYRRVYLGLANDKLDEDGQPLPPGAKNYLELYGIFPTMSVLRARFVDDSRTCIDDAAKAALEAVDAISYIPPAALRRNELKVAALRKELEAARKKARARTLAELAEKAPEFAPKVRLYNKRMAEKPAMAAAEKRLACEGFLKPGKNHKTGVYDQAMQEAVKAFQQKHMIYESHFLRRQTMDALERELIENDHRSLLRSLRERVVSAAAIIEDGTITGNTAAGPAPPNLADEFTAVAAKALGLDTPEGALAFFQKHPATDFARFRVGVKFPPLPPWYGPEMPLSIEIDRGDVWYDLAFDEKGDRLPQPRKKYPSFTLQVEWKGKKLPLARWRTTIGGWRAEQAPDGYEYYRYKGSDVGPRVIRQVIAGPVWIAPASTPIRSLVKHKVVMGRSQQVVNYSELGPGYLSAYGLVAGYFVVPGKNGRG